jgi:hypothetical protein
VLVRVRPGAPASKNIVADAQFRACEVAAGRLWLSKGCPARNGTIIRG